MSLSFVRPWLCLVGLAGAACASSGDAAPDAASHDASADAGADAGVRPDAGRPDGNLPPDAGSGGGGPVIDGTFSPEEWAGADVATNTVVTAWGEANYLTRLHAKLDADFLYLAIEGQVESGAGNAVVLYLDTALGAEAGVGSLFDLTDGDGELDDALSAGLTTPEDFRADLAFGTKDMGRAAAGFDDRMGWRDIAANPADFSWIEASEAPVVCGASVCETRLPRARLGDGTAPLAMFARITNADGTDFANQTLPEDDAENPATVQLLLNVDR